MCPDPGFLFAPAFEAGLELGITSSEFWAAVSDLSELAVGKCGEPGLDKPATDRERGGLEKNKGPESGVKLPSSRSIIWVLKPGRLTGVSNLARGLNRQPNEG